MKDSVILWLSGGIVGIIAYVVISNTLWFLFGAKFLQSLPGVNIRGVRGTLRIAAMLLMAVVGGCIWLIKLFARVIKLPVGKTSLKDEVSQTIQKGSRLLIWF